MINFLEKYLNRKLYLEKKQIKLVKNDTEIFKNKYEKYINDIQAGLKNKKEIGTSLGATNLFNIKKKNKLQTITINKYQNQSFEKIYKNWENNLFKKDMPSHS